MSKKQILLLIVVLIFGYIATLAGAFFMLKSNPSEEIAAIQDSLAVMDSLRQELKNQPLDLTWDVSGQSGPANPVKSQQDLEKRMEEERQKAKQETRQIADSLVTEKTQPVREEVTEARQEVEEIEDRVEGLENLLAILSTEADSLDQANAKRLAKIVESMRADDAAKVLSRLNSRTTAQLLISMRQRQAAKILAEMPPDRAANIARYLSKAYDEISI